MKNAAFLLAGFVLAALGFVAFRRWIALAPTTPRDEGAILTDASSPWRARVLRAAIRYRDAVAQGASEAMWPGWPFAIASSRLVAEAATNETQAQLSRRVRVLGVPPAAVLDAMRPATSAELGAALGELRAAVAAPPPLPPTIVDSGRAARVTTNLARLA